MSLFRLGKRASTALFLCILSSCSTCSPGWVYETSLAKNAAHSSGRIYLCASNHYSGLEIELMNTPVELRMYINIFGLEIPADPDDPTISKVYISFKDHSYTFCAPRFAGGQRLLVPENVKDEIIFYLGCDQPVFIRVGRYEADIYPLQFLEVYNRLILMRF